MLEQITSNIRNITYSLIIRVNITFFKNILNFRSACVIVHFHIESKILICFVESFTVYVCAIPNRNVKIEKRFMVENYCETAIFAIHFVVTFQWAC